MRLRKYLLKISRHLILIIIIFFPIMYFQNLINKSEIFYGPQFLEEANSVSILSANVGNNNLLCRDFLFKLCEEKLMNLISENIKILKPDVIILQEVLGKWQCDKQSNRSSKICSILGDETQARKMVGVDYTIVCNTRNQFECISVKKTFGSIIGCESGQECPIARTAQAIPNCDNGFTISSATIKSHEGIIFDVVNVHPQSTSSTCRANMLKAVTDVIVEEKVLISGDFNLDPWRENDKSVDAWNAIFNKGWGNNNFIYNSAITEKEPPFYTSFFLFRKRTYDFIVSNFLSGSLSVLGETPDTVRLDGGNGTDHRALYGVLRVKDVH